MPWYGAEQSFGLVCNKTKEGKPAHLIGRDALRSHAVILVSQAFGNPHPHLNLSRCVFQDIVSLSFLYIKYKAQ